MSPTAASPWSPFGQRVFAVIWTATLISNIGGWMYAAAAGWLMTSLDSSPLVVSLVQVATTLPIFLFARPAVAANGVGFNISRALGPALGGALAGLAGIAAPFIVNAVSNFGVIGALVWWRAPRHTSSGLPPERLWSAMRTGLRYARFSPPL